jgi:hypothetical protein
MSKEKRGSLRQAILFGDGVQLDCRNSVRLEVKVRMDALRDDPEAESAKAGWKYAFIHMSSGESSLAEFAEFIDALTERYNAIVDQANEAAAQVQPLKQLRKLPEVDAA